MVSKAFQVLSDSNMRAAYDRHGADPESRFSGMSSPSADTHSFGGNAFEAEISPEELFNMFFGGAMGGGGGFGGPGERQLVVNILIQVFSTFVQYSRPRLVALV